VIFKLCAAQGSVERIGSGISFESSTQGLCGLLQWLTFTISATWKAEIGRTEV
jgi:hypothetical protein